MESKNDIIEMIIINIHKIVVTTLSLLFYLLTFLITIFSSHVSSPWNHPLSHESYKDDASDRLGRSTCIIPGRSFREYGLNELTHKGKEFFGVMDLSRGYFEDHQLNKILITIFTWIMKHLG